MSSEAQRACAADAAQGDAQHQVRRPATSKPFIRSSTGSAVGCVHLVDDPAVREEQHAVGVGRPPPGRG